MQKTLGPIDNFNGYFEFLNNDFPTWVYLDGVLYPSVTTAYQASRTSDQQIRKDINNSETYEQLTEIANKIKNPPDWSSRRYKVMEALVRDKFKRNKQIREKLMTTDTRHLINTYQKGGDNETYWGTVQGSGLNSLGKILETIRDEIRKGIDTERWLARFSLEKNLHLIPKITLKVEKDNEAIEKLQLAGKSFYTFGRVDPAAGKTSIANDFQLDHLSISRNHACIFVDTDANIYLVDMASSAGTFLNDVKIESLQPKMLAAGDKIKFGMSTRKYIVGIDTKEMEQYTHRRSEEVRQELKEIQTLKKDPSQLSNQQIRSKLGFKVNDCLMVENVPPYTSVRKLKDIFGEYARVKDVNICIDTKTGKQVGVAVVSFYNEKEVQQIIIKRIKFEISGKLLVLKLFDQFQANKLIQSYSIAKKEKRSRSRSRSRDRHRDRRQRR